MSNVYTLTSRRSGYTRRVALVLGWEVHCTSVSDDHCPEESDAHDLLELWARRYPPGPDGLVPIYWYVRSEPSGIFESAPQHGVDRDLLTYFSTDRPVLWSALPVADSLWRPGRGDKGGFVQTATGWKPSPLQPSVYLPTLLADARIRRDDTRRVEALADRLNATTAYRFRVVDAPAIARLMGEALS